MQDEELLRLTRVVDDSTGIWAIGEVEFSIRGDCVPWLETHPQRRIELIKMLRFLADACERHESPFVPLSQPEGR